VQQHHRRLAGAGPGDAPRPAPGATGLPSSVSVELNYAPPSGSLRAVAQGTGATVNGTAFTAAPPPTSARPFRRCRRSRRNTTYTVYVDAVYPREACEMGENNGPR